MKKLKINYTPGLGDYLDSLQREWEGMPNENKIKISYRDPEDLFLLGKGYGEYKSKYKL